MPNAEESAAIVAALEIASATRAQDAAEVSGPQTTRWRLAGRAYGALERKRFRSPFEDERRS